MSFPWDEKTKERVTSLIPERRLALIHRVIVPDKEYPREYAILLTDRRSIFIRQKKTRSTFVLRGEMRYGTALVTDVTPKTLEDYEPNSLESLRADSANLTVPPRVAYLACDEEGTAQIPCKRLFHLANDEKTEGGIPSIRL